MHQAANKSRNCSGNSITAGLFESGIMNGNGTAPVMIPGTNGTISPKNGSPMKSGGNQPEISGNQLGLFDLTSNSNGSTTSASEVNRLKEELLANRQRMASWEEALQRAQKACEMWKNEATMAARKAESAVREKEAAMLKLAQMQKEIDTLSGGPHLHAIRRVQDLKSAPMGALKTLDWQLRKDLQEVEKVMLKSITIIYFQTSRRSRTFFRFFCRHDGYQYSMTTVVIYPTVVVFNSTFAVELLYFLLDCHGV